jgi:chromosome segregation ATPase
VASQKIIIESTRGTIDALTSSLNSTTQSIESLEAIVAANERQIAVLKQNLGEVKAEAAAWSHVSLNILTTVGRQTVAESSDATDPTVC